MTWEVKSLDELIDDGVIELGRGKVISKIDLEATPGPYPVYSSAKENDGMFGSYGHYMFDEELITWSVDGGGNLFHRPKHKFSVTNVGGTLRILDRSKFHYQYLFYVLTYLHSSIPFDWVLKAHPSVIRRLYQEIPLAPLPEQQRIVGKLDAAFAALSAAVGLVERNRANARELFESYLNGVFERKGDGWVEKQLTDVARIRTGKVDANHQAGDGKYAFYTCAFGQFKSPTWSFEGPSVILPGNGANVGVTFFYDGRFEAYQRTYVVNEFGAEVNPRYAYFCFRAGWKPYIATRQFGSATNYIVLGDLKQFPVHLPSLKEQAILLGEFEEMEQHVLELETTYQQKLSDLDALKKGLLGAAFRGEL